MTSVHILTDSRKARCYGKVDLRSGTEHCQDSDELSEDGTMAACCCSVGKLISVFVPILKFSNISEKIFINVFSM